MNILLIEDNSIEAKYLITMFEREKGVELSVAKSLIEGIKKAQEVPPPCIVMLDLDLPDSDVEETLPKFLKECPTIPVFITTSKEDIELAKRLGYAGAAGYSLKQSGVKHILHLLYCAMGVTQREQERLKEKEALKLVIEEQLNIIVKSTSGKIVPEQKFLNKSVLDCLEADKAKPLKDCLEECKDSE